MDSFLSEEVGFEPTVPCRTPVFKTGAIDHSATLPYWSIMQHSMNDLPNYFKTNPLIKSRKLL